MSNGLNILTGARKKQRLKSVLVRLIHIRETVRMVEKLEAVSQQGDYPRAISMIKQCLKRLSEQRGYVGLRGYTQRVQKMANSIQGRRTRRGEQ